MMTFLAPALMWARASSSVRKKPVDSTTTSAPTSPHGRSAGSFSQKTRIFLPSTQRTFSSLQPATSCGKMPWTESYFSM